MLVTMTLLDRAGSCMSRSTAGGVVAVLLAVEYCRAMEIGGKGKLLGATSRLTPGASAAEAGGSLISAEAAVVGGPRSPHRQPQHPRTTKPMRMALTIHTAGSCCFSTSVEVDCTSAVTFSFKASQSGQQLSSVRRLILLRPCREEGAGVSRGEAG